ncbi:MAG TPA: hypothetical protein VLR69_12780 [Thermoanaerobaculia bacterium]|nr:hypothetical protein [Thermoanaerobaculia bacterium]
MKQLVNRLWLEQIAQAVLAQVAQGRAWGEGVARQELDRRREENLLAMASGHQPGEAVEGGREVVAVLVWDGFSGMQRHPYA